FAPGSVWISYWDGSGIVTTGARVNGFNSVGSFGSPLRVPGSSGGNFGDIAVGPSGQGMVTYQGNIEYGGPATIWVNTDPDGLGPAGFGPSIAVGNRSPNTNVGGHRFIPAQPHKGVSAEASLAWDRSGGPRNGRVYLAYTDAPSSFSNDLNIFMRFSDNNGTTWSAPIRANDDTGTNSQFNPALAVDHTTGQVALALHDARRSAGNNTAEIWGTVSTDGGQTFARNVQIGAGLSDVALTGSGEDFGDYDTMDFYGGNFYRSWADNNRGLGGNPDWPRFDIATAR